jgi:hypothetical protein
MDGCQMLTLAGAGPCAQVVRAAHLNRLPVGKRCLVLVLPARCFFELLFAAHLLQQRPV